MKRNIFEKSAKLYEVFKDERYLYPEFVPERLPHRDAEIDALVYAFNPVLKGKRPVNVSVLGPSGVGKTCVVKFVLKELEEFTDRAKGVYINCFEFNTRQSVLYKIATALGMVVPRRGLATDEVYSLFLEALRKSEAIPIIVLDEVDQLKEDHASKVLYDLLRVVEHQKARHGLVVLSNNMNLRFDLDSRIKSSLNEEKMIFNPYTPQQLKDILNERSQYAFQSNGLEDEVINVAAAHAARLGGDCRVAIESLLKAGRLAENANAQKLSLDHLKQAFEAVESTAAQKFVKHLSEPEKKIVKVVALKEKLSSGELYTQFNRSGEKLSERRLRDLVSRLESLKLLKTELDESRGKTRLISLAVSKDLIERELE